MVEHSVVRGSDLRGKCASSSVSRPVWGIEFATAF